MRPARPGTAGGIFSPSQRAQRNGSPMQGLVHRQRLSTSAIFSMICFAHLLSYLPLAEHLSATLLLIFLFEHPACTFEASTRWLYLLFMNNMIKCIVALETDLQVQPCGTGPLRTHIVSASPRAAQFVRPLHKADRPARCARRSAKSRSAGPLYSFTLQTPHFACLVFLYTYKRLGGMPAVLCNAAEKRSLSCLLSMQVPLRLLMGTVPRETCIRLWAIRRGTSSTRVAIPTWRKPTGLCLAA